MVLMVLETYVGIMLVFEVYGISMYSLKEECGSVGSFDVFFKQPTL